MLNILEAKVIALDANNFSQIILTGMFGLTSILIAVFSLVSNKVLDRSEGFSLMTLKRYKKCVLLIPAYLVFLMILLMKCPIFNNDKYVIISSIVVIVIVSLQSNSILDPLYKAEKYKNIMTKLKIKEIKKIPSLKCGIRNFWCYNPGKTNFLIRNFKLYKKTKQEFDKIANEKKKNFIKSINEVKTIICGNYISESQKKDIFDTYILVSKIAPFESDEIKLEIIKFGEYVFGKDFYLQIDNIDLPIYLVFEVLFEKISNGYDEKIYHSIILMLIKGFELMENKSLDKQYLDEQIRAFLKITFSHFKTFEHITEFIYNTDLWKEKDTLFITNILHLTKAAYVDSKVNSILKGFMNSEIYNKYIKLMESYINETDLKTENIILNRRFKNIIANKGMMK